VGAGASQALGHRVDVHLQRERTAVLVAEPRGDVRGRHAGDRQEAGMGSSMSAAGLTAMSFQRTACFEHAVQRTVDMANRASVQSDLGGGSHETAFGQVATQRLATFFGDHQVQAAAVALLVSIFHETCCGAL
jgi:hypothetical protein